MFRRSTARTRRVSRGFEQPFLAGDGRQWRPPREAIRGPACYVADHDQVAPRALPLVRSECSRKRVRLPLLRHGVRGRFSEFSGTAEPERSPQSRRLGGVGCRDGRDCGGVLRLAVSTVRAASTLQPGRGHFLRRPGASAPRYGHQPDRRRHGSHGRDVCGHDRARRTRGRLAPRPHPGPIGRPPWFFPCSVHLRAHVARRESVELLQ
jgi:hypothetical protein